MSGLYSDGGVGVVGTEYNMAMVGQGKEWDGGYGVYTAMVGEGMEKRPGE